MFRELRNKLLLLPVSLLFGLWSSAQVPGDSIPYERYTLKPVVYADLGFSTAPIKLKYPFEDGIHKLKLKNNMSAVFGLGFSYKWFALRLSLTIPGTIRPTARYGNTKYFNIGGDFTVKRFFFDINFHIYRGYVIKDAYRWNDSLNSSKPNDIRPDINSASFSFNTWFFRSKHFKMQAFRGKTGAYKKDVHSLYFKYTFNVQGMSSSDGMPIVPIQLQDSTQSKTRSNSLTSVDFGVIPGMAYVKRWRYFQIGAMGGLGLVIQSKFYTYDNTTRGFLGLAPRYDVKLIAGYNQPHYFLMFVSDFDNKSIRFNNLVYRQNFYSLKLVGGIRFDRKKKEEVKKKKKL